MPRGKTSFLLHIISCERELEAPLEPKYVLTGILRYFVSQILDRETWIHSPLHGVPEIAVDTKH
jgi:hypothetical protein